MNSNDVFVTDKQLIHDWQQLGQGDHVHTINKALFYYELNGKFGMKNERKLELEKQMRIALATGDFKQLSTSLRGWW